MAHPLSTNTHVFPFATKRSVFPYDHVLNEQNISNMIKTVLDSQNYLIDIDKETRSVKFVINGYYFDTVVPSNLDLSNLLWVTVSTFTEDKDNKGYQYLSASDNGASAEAAIFTGITFSTSQPTENLSTSLKILDKGSINTEAYIKFDPKSIDGYLDASVNLLDDLDYIKNSIDAESQTRAANDTVLNNIFKTLKSDLEAESTARSDSDKTLSSQLATVESKLQNAVDKEAKDRSDQDSIHTTNIENNKKDIEDILYKLKWKSY